MVAAATKSQSTLTAFGNEGEFQAYVAGLKSAAEKQRRAEQAARNAAQKAARKKYLKDWRKAHPSTPPSGPPGGTGSIAGVTSPGASVVIENAATGFIREITANADGTYRVGALPTGTYKVKSDGASYEVDVSIGTTANTGVEGVTVVGGGSIEYSAPDPGENSDASLGDGITNVQTAGIDEGGIVKKSGDFLFVLRRGRLFSIRADATTLKTISTVDAYGAAVSPEESWYDEMLVSDNTIVVIGYSYARGGTEIGLFNFSDDGKISYRATYHLLSNDYYSSRDYASRLVGNTLIFYSPIDLFSWDHDGPFFPGIRRWNDAAANTPFQRILPAERIYRSRLAENSLRQTLHTVTKCELSAAAMDCRSTSVLGPNGSAFYVSRDAVYVWMVGNTNSGMWAGDEGDLLSSVLRMPLDDSPPSALRVQGSPIDQLSFLEKDGYLNVLVGAEAKGLRMWAAEGKSGGLALLRVPVGDFGDAGTWATSKDYRALPSGAAEEDGFWSVHNRYVGDWLLYGSEETGSAAFALRIDRKDPATRFTLGHDVERIEAMGKDALIVGSDGRDLRMSSVALDDTARATAQYLLPGTSQSESRTHGYFYRALADRDGLFGLPIVEEGQGRALVEFVRNDQLRLHGVGDLAAATKRVLSEDDDACVASCYDWYGDARPIFIGDRVYALLGYELVEGELHGGRIRERRRVNFMPPGKNH